MEMSRLFEAFATGSSLESIALKASIVLPSLLLQKPHRASKTKEHISCLKRRFQLWLEGDISALVKEGRTIQHRIPKGFSKRSNEQLSRTFANLMFEGKTQAALQLLSQREKGGLLHLEDNLDSSDTSSPTVKENTKGETS